MDSIINKLDSVIVDKDSILVSYKAPLNEALTLKIVSGTESEDKQYYLDLSILIKRLISNIRDKNNKQISEFRFIQKEEYGPYKPYIVYDKEDPERTIIAVKLWLYMLFKKAYTLKHINSESLNVYIKYKENDIPDVYLQLSKSQYNKIIHPKNLGQFPEIKEILNIIKSENDMDMKIFVNDKDIDIQSINRYRNNEWNSVTLSTDKYDYYAYKFNPFVF